MGGLCCQAHSSLFFLTFMVLVSIREKFEAFPSNRTNLSSSLNDFHVP